MSVSPNRDDLQRIIVLNPKGGCGKTSIATNLASAFALGNAMPTLMDCDPQGASMRWLENRPRMRPAIHGIAAFRNSLSVTRTWQQRVPLETRQVIIDTPAGLDGPQIHDLIYDASNLIIPVLPSPIDIRFAARFIAELLLSAQLDRRSVQVGIVANRTRKNTKSLRQLIRFLSSLKIPVVAVLRDSQCFVNAAGRGLGIAEMPRYQARQDMESFATLLSWLNQWQPPRVIEETNIPNIVVEEGGVKSVH
jgi:chromosome partitioning protein